MLACGKGHLACVRLLLKSNAAIGLAERVLHEVFDEKPGGPLDIVHGSRLAQHQARLKLDDLRRRVESVLVEVMGKVPEQDVDEDYLLPIGDVQVVVAPRAVPGGPALVRVFAVTNVGVNVTPELGLFLARLNFGLMFGRFALDTEHRSIWFDETLLGDELNEEALRFAIKVVSTTADDWDDRLKQMFGGLSHQEVSRGVAPRQARRDSGWRRHRPVPVTDRAPQRARTRAPKEENPACPEKQTLASTSSSRRAADAPSRASACDTRWATPTTATPP